MRIVARRSIRSRFDSPAGTLLTRGHLVFQRPGDGLGPAELDKVLGRSLCVPKAAGDKIAVEDVR
jgi:sialic acid synthase SpsE